MNGLTNSATSAGSAEKMRRRGPIFNKSSHRDAWYRIENKKAPGKATVYIYDEIGMWGLTAQDFVNEINELEDVKNIELHLNTPGGNVFDGLAIYNTLRQHPASVHVIIDAMAASIGSVVAQAGDQVTITRNGTMMIHDAMMLAAGNAEDMLEAADILNRFSDNIADIYAFNAGGDVKEWRARMKAETWYSAKEALDAGLVNEMLDADDEEAEEATDRWDLSVFNHAGRADAPSPAEVEVLVLNQLKEGSMARKASNSTTDPAPEEPTAPQVPAPEPEEDEEEDGNNEAQTPPAEPTPTPAPTPAPENSAFAFVVNGVQTSDRAAVQTHITNLENFRKETLEGGRKNFVANLAATNKIAASQITDLEEFALGLTDSQYEKWTATWNAAGSLPSMGQHAPGGQQSSDNAQAAADQQIEDLKAIVRQHKLANMPEDQIRKTDSYNRLIELVPDYKL